MIKIHIRRNEAQQIVACSINGHAGYDEHGYDIVCAAVSVLSCTAILGLQSVAEQQGIYANSSGECTIELQGAITEKGQAILATMVLGFQEIARQYDDFVSLSET